jgi:hypothetical protein
MTREHRVSRRVLLGAACAAPVLSAVEGPLARHPGLDPGPTFSSRPSQVRWIPDQVRNDEGWRRASPFQRRLESWRRWDRALVLVRRAEISFRALGVEADEALYDRRLGAFTRALLRLLRTPAPDLACLALKLDLAVDHEVAELTGGRACLIVLKRDARRLAR